jgi:hypothetical protein
MWVRRAAIRTVPPFARVPAHALERVESMLAGDDEASEEKLEDAFSRFESTQPALSSRIAAALARPAGETTLALGYFLSLAVWLAFEDTFGSRLGEISEEDLESTVQSFDFDEELRKDAPDEAVETDDVVAMEQPDIVEFVREHIDVALESNAGTIDVGEVDGIYRLVLVEVVALSYAVRPPDRYPVTKAEWSA